MKGIIMSGDHPRKCMDGTKTNTRRAAGLKEINKNPDDWELVSVFQDGLARFYCPLTGADITIKCPYGGYGDRLWVREKHAILRDMVEGDIEIPVYWTEADDWEKRNMTWKPSIHMFRKDSRITLEITEVRVERVQETSSFGVDKEGCTEKYGSDEAHKWFSELWDSLNAKRGYSWEANPWVWVLSFKLVK